jgi:hypothetical protein
MKYHAIYKNEFRLRNILGQPAGFIKKSLARNKNAE